MTLITQKVKLFYRPFFLSMLESVLNDRRLRIFALNLTIL